MAKFLGAMFKTDARALEVRVICFVFPTDELASVCGGRLERIFQAFLQPLLNTRAAPQFVGDQTLGHYLPELAAFEEGI